MGIQMAKEYLMKKKKKYRSCITSTRESTFHYPLGETKETDYPLVDTKETPLGGKLDMGENHAGANHVDPIPQSVLDSVITPVRPSKPRYIKDGNEIYLDMSGNQTLLNIIEENESSVKNNPIKEDESSVNADEEDFLPMDGAPMIPCTEVQSNLEEIWS